MVPDAEYMRCTPLGYGAGIDIATLPHHDFGETGQPLRRFEEDVNQEVELRCICSPKYCWTDRLVDPVLLSLETSGPEAEQKFVRRESE